MSLTQSLVSLSSIFRMDKLELPTADPRVFHAPDGYKRLTINLREDVHKALKRRAIEQDTTVTKIIEKLVTGVLA